MVLIPGHMSLSSCSGCISSLLDKGSVCPSCDLPFLPKGASLMLLMVFCVMRF